MAALRVLLFCFLLHGLAEADEKCSIEYSPVRSAFTPLVQDAEGVLLTPSYEDVINVPAGSSVTFTCMQHVISNTQSNSIEATCDNGQLKSGQKIIKFSDISCQMRVIELFSGVAPESCSSNLLIYQFTNNKNNIPKDIQIPEGHIVGETCYNQSIPVYSHFKVSSPPKYVQHSDVISDGPFSSTVDILSTYRSDKLNKKVANVLGGTRAVNDTLYSVSLIPAELVHPQLKDVSRRAHNLVGMWGSIKDGNWENLLNDIKSINRKSREFDVYTGTYQVLSLPNTNNKLTELYLETRTNKSSYPIPAYIWTVVYEPGTQKGVAIVIVNNNINIKSVEELSICTSVCDEIHWIKNLKNNNNYEAFNLGYTMCCDLNPFRGVLEHIPAINNIRVKEGNEGLLRD